MKAAAPSFMIVYENEQIDSFLRKTVVGRLNLIWIRKQVF